MDLATAGLLAGIELVELARIGIEANLALDDRADPLGGHVAAPVADLEPQPVEDVGVRVAYYFGHLSKRLAVGADGTPAGLDEQP